MKWYEIGIMSAIIFFIGQSYFIVIAVFKKGINFMISEFMFPAPFGIMYDNIITIISKAFNFLLSS